MLCRVFHKRKGEVASSSSTVENLESSSSPPLMVDQSTFMAEGCCSGMMMGSSDPAGVSHLEGNSSNPFLNLAVLHYNFLDFPQELDTTGMMGMEMGMGSKDDDAYGFLLDVGLQDDEHGGLGVKGIGNVEDIRF